MGTLHVSQCISLLQLMQDTRPFEDPELFSSESPELHRRKKEGGGKGERRRDGQVRGKLRVGSILPTMAYASLNNGLNDDYIKNFQRSQKGQVIQKVE